MTVNYPKTNVSSENSCGKASKPGIYNAGNVDMVIHVHVVQVSKLLFYFGTTLSDY